MKTEKKKTYAVEIQTFGGYHGDEGDLDKLQDYLDGVIFDNGPESVACADDLVISAFWSYVDSLDCKATAEAIADSAMATCWEM